jgi:hypothetical protein
LSKAFLLKKVVLFLYQVTNKGIYHTLKIKIMEILFSKLSSKVVKAPLYAGGEFLYTQGKTKSLKCKKVGYELFLCTYQTDVYDGYEDKYLINQQKIKNVFL